MAIAEFQGCPDKTRQRREILLRGRQQSQFAILKICPTPLPRGKQ